VLGGGADGDVAPVRVRPYVDPFVIACSGACGGVQVVVDMAVARVEVESGGSPAGDPDLDAPGCGLATSEPRWMLPTRIQPLAVLALTEPCERSTSMWPFAALTLRSPLTSRICVSPLEFRITAEPSISPARTSPVPVASSASPVTRSSVMSPRPLLSSQRPSGPVE
jgi:hypothetical protein